MDPASSEAAPAVSAAAAASSSSAAAASAAWLSSVSATRRVPAVSISIAESPMADSDCGWGHYFSVPSFPSEGCEPLTPEADDERGGCFGGRHPFKLFNHPYARALH